MTVDMNPAEGRIAMLRGRSTEVFPWYLKGGVITRMAGKRAYFLKEDGTETFSHEFSAVVDTREEEQALLGFTALAKRRLDDLLAELRGESMLLEESLNARPQKLKSISTRVRRARA